jgi:hypothetical protein
MPRRPKTTPCVVCHRHTIVPDAANNHPYGAAWEDRCIECGSNQTENAWFAELYEMPGDLQVTLRCPFVDCRVHERCTAQYTVALGDVLKHTPSVVQFRCKSCDNFVFGEDLVRSNMDVLEQIAGRTQHAHI